MQPPEPRLDVELRQLAARGVPGILICLDEACSYLNPLGFEQCQRCGVALFTPPHERAKERVH